MGKDEIRFLIPDMIGTILVAFGVLGKFGSRPALHPLLESSDVTTGMIVVGVFLMYVGMKGLIPVLQRRAEQEKTGQ